MYLEKNEIYYLEKIFKAIPHMSDFEKGRLFGIAEEMERSASLMKADKSDSYASKTVSACKAWTPLDKDHN